MKKNFFIVVLLFLTSALSAQQKGTIEYLDSNPRYGEIAIGDSLTHCLTKLSLLEEKGNGGFKCEVTDKLAECYKMGGLSPFAIYVDVKNYRIKSILIYFKTDELVELKVLAYMAELYGDKYNLGDDGVNWFGNKNFVTCGYSNDLKTYHAIISTFSSYTN